MIRKIYRVISWGLVLWGVISILLLLRKPSFTPVATSPQARESFDRKLGELKAAIAQGQPGEFRFTETELNSKLQQTIESGKSLPAGGISLQAATLHLGAEDFLGTLTLDFHGMNLYVTLGGKLALQDHQLRFAPSAVRLGSLPLPAFVMERVVRSKLDSPEMQQLMKVPDALKDARVENQELVLQCQ